MKNLILCSLILFSFSANSQMMGKNKIANNSLSDEEIALVLEQMKATLKEMKVPANLLPKHLKDPLFNHKFSKQLLTSFKDIEPLKKFIEDGDFEITPALMIGFADSSVVGLELKSENYKLCLPCTVNHNSFVFGMIENKTKSKKVGNEMKCAKIVDGLAYQRNFSNHLNALVLPYTNASKEKGHIIYQNSSESYHLVMKKELLDANLNKPIPVACNDKKFTYNDRYGHLYVYEMDEDKTPNEAKCMSVYNPEIEELVQKNLKAGLDVVFDKFLTETKEKETFLEMLKPCEENSYGKKIIGKIKDHSESGSKKKGSEKALTR